MTIVTLEPSEMNSILLLLLLAIAEEPHAGWTNKTREVT
jgi:hypothetical protein